MGTAAICGDVDLPVAVEVPESKRAVRSEIVSESGGRGRRQRNRGQHGCGKCPVSFAEPHPDAVSGAHGKIRDFVTVQIDRTEIVRAEIIVVGKWHHERGRERSIAVTQEQQHLAARQHGDIELSVDLRARLSPERSRNDNAAFLFRSVLLQGEALLRSNLKHVPFQNGRFIP